MAEREDAPVLPPHAYVPGQNARHPEDWFDPIKASVRPDLPPDLLHRTAAWKAGLFYYDQGYFWECHEVLEAVWMQTAEGSLQRDLVQALIQLANARLKLRMARPKAAWRLCDMVESILARCPSGQTILGLDPADLRAEVAGVRQATGH